MLGGGTSPLTVGTEPARPFGDKRLTCGGFYAIAPLLGSGAPASSSRIIAHRQQQVWRGAHAMHPREWLHAVPAKANPNAHASHPPATSARRPGVPVRAARRPVAPLVACALGQLIDARLVRVLDETGVQH